jgi:hypothetical protein
MLALVLLEAQAPIGDEGYLYISLLDSFLSTNGNQPGALHIIGKRFTTELYL